MIFDIVLSDVNAYIHTLVESLANKKKESPDFTVIDVGGSVSGWSSPVTDAIVDINPPEVQSRIRFFKVNINDYASWDPVIEHVKEHGKFSFAICSHTLEDICNPGLVLQMLPKIAKAGAISMPSKYHEFTHVEGPYLGYIHHRWIYDVRDNKLIGYPKLGFLEHFKELHKLGNTNLQISQLAFQWQDSIEYEFVNGDYLGPNVASVYRYYLRLLD